MRSSREEIVVNKVKTLMEKMLNLVCETTLGQHDDVDILVTGSTSTGSVEVKERYLTIDKLIQYLTVDGLIIEHKKYNDLINDNGMYVNYIKLKNVDVMIMWRADRIDKVQYDDTFKFSKTTEFGVNDKITKNVYKCFLENLSFFFLKDNKDNKWKKIKKEEIEITLKNIKRDE